MIIGISGKKRHGKDATGRLIQYHLWKERMEYSGFHAHSGYTQSFFINGSDQGLQSGFAIKKFATKLKQMVAIILGCTVEMLEDDKFKNTPLGEEWRAWYWTHYKFPSPRVTQLFSSEQEAIDYRIDGKTVKEFFGDAARLSSGILTPRLLLQLIGTDCGRKIIHPNIWLNSMFADYKAADYTYGKATKVEGVWMWGNKQVPYETVMIANEKPKFPDWIITDVRFENEVQSILDRGGIMLRIHNPREDSTDTHESETALDNYHFTYWITNDGTLEDLSEKVRIFLQSINLIA